MVAEPGGARDSGFTLLETIVVVLMIAVLASVMAAVIAVIYRNAPTTEARTDDSRSYQGLITGLPRHAASTPAGSFEGVGFLPSGPTWSCSEFTGPALVQMSWNQQGIAYVAGYRLEPDGDGQRVVRYGCSGSDATSTLSGMTTRNVTGRLHDADAIPITDGSSDIGVRIELATCGETGGAPDCTVAGPLVIAVEALSHNPAETLP